MISIKKFVQFLSLVCLLVAGFSLGFAQTPPPPPVLLIVREEIKTGKIPAHTREAERYAQVLAKAKSPYHRLGMSPVAGNENEVMYFWGFGSFAEMEKSQMDIERWATGQFKADFDSLIPPNAEDNHVSQRDMVAVLRDDMSYRPKPINIGDMRYMQITTLRVRPGQEGAFREAARLYVDAMKKGRVDENFAMYQILSGTVEGIYLVVSPMKSLAEMDTYLERQKPFMNALGEDGMKKLEKLASEAFNVGESSIYRFDPRISYVTREWAAADPSFWNPPAASMATMPASVNRRMNPQRNVRRQ